MRKICEYIQKQLMKYWTAEWDLNLSNNVIQRLRYSAFIYLSYRENKSTSDSANDVSFYGILYFSLHQKPMIWLNQQLLYISSPMTEKIEWFEKMLDPNALEVARFDEEMQKRWGCKEEQKKPVSAVRRTMWLTHT